MRARNGTATKLIASWNTRDAESAAAPKAYLRSAIA
jgi:hypothetical protein